MLSNITKILHKFSASETRMEEIGTLQINTLLYLLAISPFYLPYNVRNYSMMETGS